MAKSDFFVPGDIFKDPGFQNHKNQRLRQFFENQLLAEFWDGTAAARDPELHMRMLAILGEEDSFSILIENDDDFTVPRTVPWKNVIDQNKDNIKKALPACGRLESLNRGTPESYGSAWLARADVLVTNSHVAYRFCDFEDDEWKFLNEVKVDFSHKPDTASGRKNYKLTDILHIEKPANLKLPNPKPDMAFFRVKPMDDFEGEKPNPIVLASTDERPNHVAIIGFPSNRDNCNTFELVNRIFRGKFNRKNLQPGLAVENDWPNIDVAECCRDAAGMPKLVTSATSLAHTCPTVSGNSGSVLLDIETGKAAGLHFGGCIGAANFAVPASQIRAMLADF